MCNEIMSNQRYIVKIDINNLTNTNHLYEPNLLNQDIALFKLSLQLIN